MLGSVVDRSTIERVRALTDDAVAKGARLVTGGAGETTIMPATVVDRVTPEMRLFSEESFGPIVAVVRVDGVEEAIAAANDSEYGLAAAVFGRDVTRALAWRGGSRRGSCMSTARRCTTRRRCRSAG